jgi:FecR protein
MKAKAALAVAFLLCIANPLRAEQLFERAGVTKTINDCSVLPRNRRAVVGDVITGDLALRTGGASRAELEFPDLTITRIGANALFRFLAGQRKIILDGGTMLFHSSKGGATVQAGAVTAAVTGTDFLISNINKRVKVICLSGKILVYFTANPKARRGLKPGQMVDIPAGATTIPAATTVNLATLLATSMLGSAGGMGPFPNQAAIEKNARNQQGASLLGGSLPAQAVTTQATQAGQATRSITTANSLAQQTAAQQAAAQQTAAQQAATQQAAAATAAQQLAAQQAAAAQLAAQQAAAQQLAAQRVATRQVAQQAAAQQAAAQQAAAQQAAAQQAAAQQAAAQQAAAQQAAAQQQAAANANQANQGQGPQGNQGRGPQGNQGQGIGVGGTPPGQGNQGQGPQGNQGNPNPPGQNR